MPDPIIITVAGGKGGVGKSTTAISLAVEWYVRGLRVLVVDNDEQRETALTWSDVAAKAEHDTPVVNFMRDNVRAQVPKLAAGFDVVIIDTAGERDERLSQALSIADFVLLPCGPNGPEIWDVSKTIAHMRSVQGVLETIGRELDAAIVVTRKQVGTVIGRRAAVELQETGVDVLETELELLVGYAEAITAGLGPTTYGPNSKEASQTRALADELERRIGFGKKGRRRVAV